MPNLTPNATITLAEQALASPAFGYALLIRAAGSVTPLGHLAMLQGQHGTRVTVDGAPQDPTSDHESIPSGSSVGVTLTQADVSAALPLRALDAEVVLAARDATGAWAEALAWSVTVDLIAPSVNARAWRDPANRILVTVTSGHEDATEATLDSSAGSDTRAWSGARDGQSGAKAFTFTLPEDATDLTATVSDAAGNTASIAIDTPTTRPLDPPLTPHWALPPWLADHGSTAPILTGAAETNATSDNARQQIDPTQAEGGYLDEHARVYGTPRYARERDWQLRERMLAIPKNRATSRTPLEQHLTRVAGVPVRINDAGTGLSEGWVRLDGTHQLDGTWDLGGPGANLDPGSYLVRFDENPRVPMRWLIDELNRLRPAGILPDVRMLRFQTARVGAIAAHRRWSQL